jgi:hypothetical protein
MRERIRPSETVRDVREIEIEIDRWIDRVCVAASQLLHEAEKIT